ncbi:MAG TPA: radical SAM protein [Candidatus Limnocylindria bacterium]|jgi:DNA repair photolyase|nr:radical SAM protein [Candidatus Limnocylindria bacterium]
MRPEYAEEPCRTALSRVSGMPFRWSLNPYTGCAHQCTFCYVRGFELRAGRAGDDRYGARIRIKTNVVEVLRRELARRSWQREEVAFGSATDPYQPAEGRYRLTRGAIRALGDFATPFGMITRGPMIVRDIDVLQRASAAAEVTVNISIPTLDAAIWRTTEPGTAHPRQRLRALRLLADAGIRAGVGMAPILPGLSDDPRRLREVVLAAREAGASFLWWNVLNLRPGTREHFLQHLARDWPEEVERYQRLYAGRAYLHKAETRQLDATMAELRSEWVWAPRRRPPPPTPEPAQLRLPLAG